MTHMRRSRGDYQPWDDICREIEACLRACPEFRLRKDVDGKVKRWEGLSHENFFFWARDREGQGRHSFFYRRISRRGVIALSEATDHLAKEILTLCSLKRLGCPFRHPEVVCVSGTLARPAAFIESAVEGFSGETFEKSPRAEELISEIATLAAQIHRLPAIEFAHLRNSATAKEHLESQLAEFPEDVLQLPVPRRAIQWIEEHADSIRPPVLLHGDLLPQNLIFSLNDEAPGVVDWEFACIGDPAYDLAIVTRGRRKLFRCPDGRKMLIDAYIQAGGASLEEKDVICHELVLILGWLWEAAERRRKGCRGDQPPEFYEQMIEPILRRIGQKGE